MYSAIISFINKKLNRNYNGYTSYFPSELYIAKEKLNQPYKVLNYIYAGIGFFLFVVIVLIAYRNRKEGRNARRHQPLEEEGP